MVKIKGYPTPRVRLFSFFGINISVAWAKCWYIFLGSGEYSHLCNPVCFFRDTTQEAGVLTDRFILWKVKVEIKFLVSDETFLKGVTT